MKNFFYLLLIVPFVSISADLRILSTTSTRDSGLYEYLLPIFEKKYDINSYVIATGTGHAIKNAEYFCKDNFSDNSPFLKYSFFKLLDNSYTRWRVPLFKI